MDSPGVDLPASSAKSGDDPPRFAGDLQPHTGREPDVQDAAVGPGAYVSSPAPTFGWGPPPQLDRGATPQGSPCTMHRIAIYT